MAMVARDIKVWPVTILVLYHRFSFDLITKEIFNKETKIRFHVTCYPTASIKNRTEDQNY